MTADELWRDQVGVVLTRCRCGHTLRAHETACAAADACQLDTLAACNGPAGCYGLAYGPCQLMCCDCRGWSP